MSRFTVQLASLLVLAAACGNGGSRGPGTDKSPERGESADGGVATGSTSDGGGGGGGGGDGGGGGATRGEGGASACYGDFAIHQHAIVGDAILSDCNDSRPATNCRDGHSIVFGNGQCLCVPACSAFENVGVGDNCTTDGQFKCMAIENASGSSSGNFCVGVDWNLCGPGGGGETSGSGGGGSGDAGGGGDEGGGGEPCAAQGATCSEDSDCCSDWCGLDGECL